MHLRTLIAVICALSLVVTSFAVTLITGKTGEAALAQQTQPYRVFQFAIGAQATVGQFNKPSDVAVAPDGAIYVADSDSHRIHRFSATGEFLGGWGVYGYGDGQFYNPHGVAVAPDGTVYVADTGNHRIQRFSATGAFLGTWGWQGYNDGQFSSPGGVAVASDGTVYVADTGNHRIQHFSASGAFLGVWGVSGSGNGQFSSPSGIAVASDGTIYVADSGNHRIQRFSATGAFLGVWGSRGSGNGQFESPDDVAVASDGTVYVADYWNNRIQRFSATGTFLGAWGAFGSSDGQFNKPSGVAVASGGTVYVADRDNRRIQRFSATGAFLGVWGAPDISDGRFNRPRDVEVAPDGTVYVADTGNHRIQRFSADGVFLGAWGSRDSGDGQSWYPSNVVVAPNGTVYVAANSRIQRFSADGAFLSEWGSYGIGDGQFDSTSGVAVAPDGTVYVADWHSHRVQHFSSEGTFLGVWKKQSWYPTDVAVASSGTVYVAASKRIQRFSADGTFLGEWGSEGRGNGQFNSISSIAMAPDGTVYVADDFNDRIQRFSATGDFLGAWGSGGSGDGHFWQPSGVAVAPDGTVYVADYYNYRIQVFGTDYPNAWRGEFFANDWLAGPVLHVENVSDLFLNRSWASQPAATIPADHFTSRWMRYVNFPTAGRYRFTIRADDGVRFWVDDRLVVESWQPQSPTREVTVELSAGYHKLLLEHWDQQGVATLALEWTRVNDGTPTLTATPSPTATPTPPPVTPTPPPAQTSWTFMLYLAGDNNLYTHLQRAVQHLEAQPANPNVTIVVLFDGDRTDDSWRFVVQPGGRYTLNVNKWHLGEVNTGDPQTLRDFILWARNAYPAQHYYLSIADHGLGTQGIAYDDTNRDPATNRKDFLSTAELRAALRAATNDGQRKIDVLHYDACLMALLENAYQVKDYADYLVASQNLGWSVFAYAAYLPAQLSGAADAADAAAPYAFADLAASVTSSTTPRQLALRVVDTYFTHPALANRYPRTISALDLSRADAVRQATDAFAAALRANLANESVRNAVRNARSAAQKFDSREFYRITDDDEYLDLYHFAQKVREYAPDGAVQTAAQGVMDAVRSFVIAERHQSGTFQDVFWDLDRAHGIGIYFPPRSGAQTYTRYINHELFQFTADGVWDEFLKDYFGIVALPPEEPVDVEAPPMLSPPQRVYLPLVVR
jgi:tripartite motif-containing protein 71